MTSHCFEGIYIYGKFIVTSERVGSLESDEDRSLVRRGCQGCDPGYFLLKDMSACVLCNQTLIPYCMVCYYEGTEETSLEPNYKEYLQGLD